MTDIQLDKASGALTRASWIATAYLIGAVLLEAITVLTIPLGVVGISKMGMGHAISVVYALLGALALLGSLFVFWRWSGAQRDHRLRRRELDALVAEAAGTA